MSYQFYGAILLLSGCGWIGFQFSRSYISHERFLQQLILSLQYIKCELPYRLTPLPELCEYLQKKNQGILGKYYSLLLKELESQAAPDVQQCSRYAIAKISGASQTQKELLEQFGSCLGQFDLSGQLQYINTFLSSCQQKLRESEESKPSRIRNYQTLALCAGAALIILFI